MPGVKVTTATIPGPSAPQTAPGSTFFVVGQAERGSTVDPIEVQSMTAYEALLGARTPFATLYDQLRTFFEEGGTRAVVARVVGPAAAAGTLNLVDRAGAPLPTLRVDAKDPGAWSANVTVQVQAGSAVGTYRLVVRYTGTGGPGVETYDNLTTPADAVAALATSAYVRATDLGSVTPGPGNQPAIAAATPLSVGTDDRAAIVAATRIAALARFRRSLGAGAVAMPGQPSAAVGAAVIAHARANRRIALLSVAQGATDNAAIAEAAALGIEPGADSAGIFGPWVVIPDGLGGRRTIAPEGFVAGVRARTHETDGPGQPPAGRWGEARFVIGTERDVDDLSGDTLDAGRVSAIRAFDRRVKLYGWRSLSTDDANWSLLSYRDLVDDIQVAAEAVLEDAAAFRRIDGHGHTFADVQSDLVGIVRPYAARDELYAQVVDGRELDPGYRVDTGPTVNTDVSIAANRIRAVLGVRPAPAGALVELTLAKAGVTATL